MKELILNSNCSINFKNGHFDLKGGAKLMRSFEHNRSAIIGFLNGVEAKFDNLITFHLFGNYIYETVNREQFSELILDQSWCSLNSKKGIVLKLIEEKSLLNGKDKNRFPKLIKDLISLRNLMAHGKVIIVGENEIEVKGFIEGRTQTRIINDVELSRIQEELIFCEKLVSKMSLSANLEIIGEFSKTPVLPQLNLKVKP